jgi:hypothetical protein
LWVTTKVRKPQEFLGQVVLRTDLVVEVAAGSLAPHSTTNNSPKVISRSPVLQELGEEGLVYLGGPITKPAEAVAAVATTKMCRLLGFPMHRAAIVRIPIALVAEEVRK